jgi:hypothetical protein
MWKKIFKRLATHYVINGTYISKEYDDGYRYSFPLQSDFLALYFSKIYYVLIDYWARKNNLILAEHKDFLEEILESEPEVPGFLYQFNEKYIKLGESLLKEYEEGKIGFEKVPRKKVGKWKRLWKNLTLSI